MEKLADIFRVLRYHGLEFYSDLSIPANVTDSNCISRLRCIFTRCCFTVFHISHPFHRIRRILVRTFILERSNGSIFFQPSLFSNQQNRSKHIIYVFSLRIFQNVFFVQFASHNYKQHLLQTDRLLKFLLKFNCPIDR